MLARSPDDQLKSDVWTRAVTTVDLPASLAERFFDRSGPLPLHHENKRSFHRYYMRGKALLKRGDSILGVYMKDVSRQGVGFLSPVQLLPLVRVQLELSDGTQINVELSRCRRIEKNCFECGARFAL